MSESRSTARLAERRERLEKGPRLRHYKQPLQQPAPSLPLGSNPGNEGMMTILTIAAHINPRAFRDSRAGVVTPIEARALAEGMITSAGERDTFHSETPEGAWQREAHAARVRFTQEKQDPRYWPRDLKRSLGLYSEKAMAKARAIWQEQMNARIPAAPALDA